MIYHGRPYFPVASVGLLLVAFFPRSTCRVVAGKILLALVVSLGSIPSYLSDCSRFLSASYHFIGVLVVCLAVVFYIGRYLHKWLMEYATSMESPCILRQWDWFG